MTMMKALSEAEYADLADGAEAGEQLDLGTANVVQMSRGDEKYLLVSTSSGHYAQIDLGAAR